MIVKRETENAEAMVSQVAPAARSRLIKASCAGVQASLWGMCSVVLCDIEQNKNIATLARLVRWCQYI